MNEPTGLRKAKSTCIRLLQYLPMGGALKSRKELSFWRARKLSEGTLGNDRYEYFFTDHFGLSRDHYKGKRVLDIGCGPRGSLEWAEDAEQRIGLDPLVPQYAELGITEHKMRYVGACSESMPFPDASFDVVSSINSLDHVSNLQRTIYEITRVLAADGLFLLLTELNHPATICEPMEFSFDIVDRFRPAFRILDERHYEKSSGGIYDSVSAGIRYDEIDRRPRYAVLSAKFVKQAP